MFDIFGIRAKRKAEKEAKEAQKIAEAQEKKKRYQERKAKIVAYYDDYYKKEDEKRREEFRKIKESVDFLNNTCPKCYSKNVIQSIVRGKGEIHGESSSTSFGGGSFLGFSSYGHGHGKIDGEYDTLPVCKCKDCGHEWNIKEAEMRNIYDIFSTYSSSGPWSLYFRIEDYLELKYNPYDEKEEFNSLEEKQENFCKKASEHWILKDYRAIPRYMIEYALYQGLVEHEYRLENLNKIYNYHEGDDQYSYTMSDELWEIVKKILKWEGTEE